MKKEEIESQLSMYEPRDTVVGMSNKSDEENLDYLRNLLQFLIREESHFSGYKDFLNQLVDFQLVSADAKHHKVPVFPAIKIAENALGRFINGEATINQHDFALVVYFLDFRGLFLDEDSAETLTKGKLEDPLFHSLVSFLQVGKITRSNVKRRAPGIYRAYRPSSTFPGQYWVGAMEVFLDRESWAIKTKEFYQSAGFDKRPNHTVQLEGYMVRKGRHYTILSRNDSASSLSTAFLPSVTVEDKAIRTMAGGVLDMSTGKLWSGRVYYERIDEPDWVMIEKSETGEAGNMKSSFDEFKNAAFKASRICTPDEIPQSIHHHFCGDPVPNVRVY